MELETDLALYVGVWLLAEALSIASLVVAKRAGAASILIHGLGAWGLAAYPVVTGLIGWWAVTDIKAQGGPLPIDFILPGLFVVAACALIFAVMAYARSSQLKSRASNKRIEQNARR